MAIESRQQGEIQERAKRTWERMDQNERTILRIGMAPLWVIQAGATNEADEELDGDEQRELSVALMTIAEQNGGMLA